jgi:hypothetical protein
MASRNGLEISNGFYRIGARLLNFSFCRQGNLAMRDEPPVIQHPAYESIYREMQRQTRQQIYISLALIAVVGAVVIGLGWMGHRQAQRDRPLTVPDVVAPDTPSQLN